MSEINFNFLPRSDLIKAQICMFQLGFKNLHTLKMKFDDFCDEIGDLVN
jgi:hypothetical protein